MRSRSIWRPRRIRVYLSRRRFGSRNGVIVVFSLSLSPSLRNIFLSSKPSPRTRRKCKRTRIQRCASRRSHLSSSTSDEPLRVPLIPYAGGCTNDERVEAVSWLRPPFGGIGDQATRFSDRKRPRARVCVCNVIIATSEPSLCAQRHFWLDRTESEKETAGNRDPIHRARGGEAGLDETRAQSRVLRLVKHGLGKVNEGEGQVFTFFQHRARINLGYR